MSEARARVDATGITLSPARDDVLDLLLDGRRVWSFRANETGEATKRGWRVTWPRDLEGFLDGVSRVALRTSTGEVLIEDEVRFGTGEGRVEVADAHGHPLVVDPSGRLVSTFESRDPAQLTPLIDALELVLEALNRAGVAAFPAYGTLLGAVRGGRLIGHDNDADVGYVSRHTHPADVILESFRLQRLLHRDGLKITRYSGAAFKVVVQDSNGVDTGLDVFAGFLREGHLVLMGEIYAPFERDWLLPLGTVELEGRVLPAPAQPERLLSLMYGPSWRVPDPTFTFTTDDAIRRRLDTWFRGTRSYRNLWDRRYSTSGERAPRPRPHDLARQLHKREEPGTTVIDVACGRGRDAVWLGQQGHPVLGLDFAGNGFAQLEREAAENDWGVQFFDMNLLETRHVLTWVGHLALVEGPRAMMARHLVNATTQRGRENFWRLARTTLRSGERLYLEFLVPREGDPARYVDPLVWDLDPAEIEAEGVRAGASVRSVDVAERDPFERPSKVVDGSPAPSSCRMVMEWAG